MASTSPCVPSTLLQSELECTVSTDWFLQERPALSTYNSRTVPKTLPKQTYYLTLIDPLSTNSILDFGSGTLFTCLTWSGRRFTVGSRLRISMCSYLHSSIIERLLECSNKKIRIWELKNQKRCSEAKVTPGYEDSPILLSLWSYVLSFVLK